MSDLEVRAARVEEFAAVGALTLAAYVSDGHLAADDPYAAHLSDAAHRASAAELLVAVERGGTAVFGTVTVCRPGTELAEVSRPDELEFRMLAVGPAARGRGVGAALVNAVIDRAREYGCRAVVLCTQPRMRSAQSLYRRLGFRPDPSRDWSPGPGIDLHAHTLTL